MKWENLSNFRVGTARIVRLKELHVMSIITKSWSSPANFRVLGLFRLYIRKSWKVNKILISEFQVSAHPIIFTLVVMIHERATNGMIRSTVNISTVWTFTVRVLIELKCCIWTEIFDVFYTFQKKKHHHQLLVSFKVNINSISSYICGELTIAVHFIFTRFYRTEAQIAVLNARADGRWIVTIHMTFSHNICNRWSFWMGRGQNCVSIERLWMKKKV